MFIGLTSVSYSFSLILFSSDYSGSQFVVFFLGFLPKLSWTYVWCYGPGLHLSPGTSAQPPPIFGILDEYYRVIRASSFSKQLLKACAQNPGPRTPSLAPIPTARHDSRGHPAATHPAGHRRAGCAEPGLHWQCCPEAGENKGKWHGLQGFSV